MAQSEHVPLPEYDGITWPLFPSFQLKGVGQALQDIKDLKSREKDIIICSFPKSGSHWTYEIVQMLLKNTSELVEELKSDTLLEMLPDLSTLDKIQSPRVLTTHVPFKFLPTKHIEDGYKIIHVLRNPKDVCVSAYYHSRNDDQVNLKIPWETHFDIWMNSKNPYGSWYDYELGIAQGESTYPTLPIHTCYYEQMKRDLVKEIKKFAEFLGMACSDGLAERIAVSTSFENMKANKPDFHSKMGKKGIIYRKGVVGDWKNHFTVDMNETFDAQFKDRMNESNYNITFE